MMSSAWMLAALLFVSGVTLEQTPGALRIVVTLPDATQSTVPIARHGLLISDNPPTREPRRVVTGADGAVAVNLAPGSYLVESDRPVAFLGQAYQWTAYVDVVAGRDTVLTLTAQNAEVVAAGAAASETAPTAPHADASSAVSKWQASLVTIWSPTTPASGFVVDARGLVATDRNAVGTATSVEVQVSPALKVPARVLVAEPTQDVSIVWLDPSALKGAVPLPLGCVPAATPPLNDGDEVVTFAAAPGDTPNLLRGEITGFHPRGIQTDLRLSFGEAGGPVFVADQSTVVGLTSLAVDTDGNPSGEVLVVRSGVVCEALAAARPKMEAATPPQPTSLPIEPAGRFPTDSPTSRAQRTSDVTAPPVVSSNSFDVALITPPTVLRARERAGWTGGRSGRPTEAEARIGRLTEFGSWTEYFRNVPPVLVVRVTPKLVESFWMRLAREAARTQGAALPPLKDFKTNFLRLRASCGGNEVAPIHPFVLEHRLAETRVIREGLYVFGPDAFGPHCRAVTLTLSTEQAPDKPDTLTIDPEIIEQIWRDFALYRTTRQ